MKKYLILIYALLLTLGGLIYFLRVNSLLPTLNVTLGFLFLVLTFGFFIGRIIKIKLSDLLSQILVYVAIGFCWIFALNFVAIFLKLSSGLLMNIYLVSWALLFIVSLVLGLLLKYKKTDVTWKFKFSLNDLFHYLPLFILIILAIVFVALQGSLFKGGDPNFHLSILRKVVDGQTLAFQNLSYIKSDVPHIAYGFPIWHITLGVLAKILNVDIFTIWQYISIPLLALSFLIWYWLFRSIFPTKNLAILALSLFIIFYFGPLYTTLPIPDTFCRLILWPLCFGLALKYIFDLKTGFRLLAILSFLLLLMGVIHMTQYFYYLFIMIVFGLIFAVVQFKQKDYKPRLKRIAAATFTNLLFLLPFALFLGANNSLFNTVKKMLSVESVEKLRYDAFDRFNFYTKFAFLSLPFLVLFFRKYGKIIFLMAVLLVIPLAYAPFLKPLLLRFPGFIFMDRLYGTLAWHFAVLALVLGFVFVLIDRGVSFLGRISGYLKYLMMSLFGAALAWLLIFEKDLHWLLNLNKIIFAPRVDHWLDRNYLWFILISLLVVVFILILGKFLPRIKTIFEIKDYENSFVIFCLTIFVLTLFFMSSLLNYKKIWMNDHLADQSKKYDYAVVGKGMVEYINEQIPSKSVILVDAETNMIMPILVDQYMVYYPHTSKETIYLKTLFRGTKTNEEKIDLLNQSQPDYAFIRTPNERVDFWALHPKIFKPIFKEKHNILYQINKKALSAEKSDPKL